MTYLDVMDIAILIIFIAVSIVVSSAKKKDGAKKSGKKPAAPMKKGQTAAGRKNTRPAAPQQQQRPAVQQSAKPQTVRMDEGADPCHEYMLSPMESQMHYEERSEADMAAAGEGEDPCHVDSAAAPQANAKPYDITVGQTEMSPAARAIVMAEVLKRPSQRRQERRMQRHRKVAYDGKDSCYHSGR